MNLINQEKFNKAISIENIDIAFNILEIDKKRKIDALIFNGHFLQVLAKKNEIKKIEYIKSNYKLNLKVRNLMLFKTAISFDYLDLFKYLILNTDVSLNHEEQFFLYTAIKNKSLKIFNYLLSKELLPDIQDNIYINCLCSLIFYEDKVEDLKVLNEMVEKIFSYNIVKEKLKNSKNEYDRKNYKKLIKMKIKNDLKNF